MEKVEKGRLMGRGMAKAFIRSLLRPGDLSVYPRANCKCQSGRPSRDKANCRAAIGDGDRDGDGVELSVRCCLKSTVCLSICVSLPLPLIATTNWQSCRGTHDCLIQT